MYVVLDSDPNLLWFCSEWIVVAFFSSKQLWHTHTFQKWKCVLNLLLQQTATFAGMNFTKEPHWNTRKRILCVRRSLRKQDVLPSTILEHKPSVTCKDVTVTLAVRMPRITELCGVGQRLCFWGLRFTTRLRTIKKWNLTVTGWTKIV